MTAVFLVAMPFSSSALGIYEITEEKTLALGITQKNIKCLTTSGWQNINVVEADLSDGRYGVKTLTNEGDLTKLANVKKLAEAHDTIAAVNGDFFSWKWDDKTRGSAIGAEIADGEYLSSPTSPYNFATVAQTDDGEFIFDYVDCAVAVAAPNGYITPIEHINKYDDLTQPIIYTKEWGPLSPGSAGTLNEIVVENDIITAIHYDAGPVEFPENGYIIGFLRNYSPEIIENFHVGDKVELGISYAPKFDDIRFAVGAGTLLLKNGEKADNKNDIPGNHPRTAIGVNADGSKLYLVTVDGRQTNAKGVLLSVLSEIMAEVGCYNAANLDGGGSTTMVTKSNETGEQEVINTLSDKYLRAVANGVGIVPSAEAENEGYITIETDSDSVFLGTGTYVNIRLRNSLGIPVEYDPNLLSVSVTGGRFENNYYYPDVQGKQTVTVSYNGLTAEKVLRVLDAPAEIATGLKEYNIGVGESAYISLCAKSEKGYSSYINLSDTGVTLSSPILSVEGNYITGGAVESAVATFEFGGTKTSAVIRVGGDKSAVSVPNDVKAEKTADGDGFTFAVFGNTVNKNTLAEKLTMKRYAEILNSGKYALSVFVGNKTALPFSVDTKTVHTDSYTISSYENATVISLIPSNITHWQYFIADAKASNTENLILLLPSTIKDDSAYIEEMLIDFNKNYLEDAGINLFVISQGEYSVTRESGIRHIQIPGIEACANADELLKKASYWEFEASGEEFSCTQIKLFE